MAIGSLRSDNPQKFTKKFVPILLFISVVTVIILALISSLSWAKAPFLGALFFPNLTTADTFDPNWQAYQQGLEVGDALIAVDEIP